jgi:putative peptidoglycan lipid II flippase
LSIGLGACINAIFLYLGLRRRGIYVARSGWGIFLVKLTGALFLMGGAALWVAGKFDWIAMQAHPLQRISMLILVLVVCAITYFGALVAMGFRPADFKRSAA